MNQKWHRRWLQLARHISTFSKDPSTKVGAVIIDKNNKLVSIGYNGFPKDVEDTTERYLDKKIKYSMIVHAEQNAILNTNVDLQDCTLYVYPTLMKGACCNECAKSVATKGIKNVVYYKTEPNERWTDQGKTTLTMFAESNVKIIEICKNGKGVLNV